jgi:hypothetical protein
MGKQFIPELIVKKLTVQNSLTPDFAAEQEFETVTATTAVETDTISEHGATNGVTVDGLLIKDAGFVIGTSGVADLNGEAYGLVLDADADTAIGASVDDVINIKVAGAEDFRITANTLTALSGSTIATNTIAETTAASGVTIDGVLLKDGGAIFADAATIEIDTINEAASAHGVIIDGVTIKDGVIDAPKPSQALTATGAITINNGMVTLAHATVVIAATLDAPAVGDDLWIINTSASGTTAHTVTAAAGVTFDGTNNTATFDAADESLHIIASSATRWRIVTNNGAVGLSSVP